jgi:hypothetical protein
MWWFGAGRVPPEPFEASAMPTSAASSRAASETPSHVGAALDPSRMPGLSGEEGVRLYYDALERLGSAVDRGTITYADYRHRVGAIHAWLAERHIYATPHPDFVWPPRDASDSDRHLSGGADSEYLAATRDANSPTHWLDNP